MEFYVKCAIFSILKWNFQNINAITAALYVCCMISGLGQPHSIAMLA